ncbi:enoyl-CoA hydratase/isomerase family protein [Prauserella cavernicola]|uniref:Enoyl-CoA hydratase/isomerase family protein n=1 Tax=Prauserella cavernicola TaxID=2800127 RepID=A0A934V799_9PSEU|nr:enoyl-CoA hydratase/isomerase family protein [Prauserella cavernicola]MBK1787479.1 enoyl-CoA hydratase/isomerase family protein [Prauserella cavernicola]
MSAEPAIRLLLDEHLARLRIHNPRNGNRFTAAMMDGLADALRRVESANVAVLVLESSGPDFTLGRDQRERVPGLSRRDNLRKILVANELLSTSPAVTISAISGHALGFGTGLALHTDLTVVEDDAVFGFDEIEHGLAPLVVVAYLSRFVPAKIARELVLTGRRVGATEAAALGIVNRVVPKGTLADATQALLDQLGEHDPGVLRLIKDFHTEIRDEPPGLGERAVDRLAGWLENR